MGTIVSVESTEWLLQREDHAAALDAIRRFARKSPRDVRDPERALEARDLIAALGAAGFDATVDAFGDLAALQYRSDKAPADASAAWPGPLLAALAPYVARGAVRFAQSDDVGFTRFEFHRGALRRARREHGIDLVPAGADVAVARGAVADVGFRVRARDPKVKAVAVSLLETPQGEAREKETRARVDAVERLRVALDPYAASPVDVTLAWSYGDARGILRVPPLLAEPCAMTDGRRTVAAAAAGLRSGAPRIAPASEPRALEAARRYASRHCDQPGASFLRAVRAATSLDGALAAAGLASERDDAGALVRLVPEGGTLRGPERFVGGVLWSLGPHLDEPCELRVTYADDPERWVILGFDEGMRPQREFVSHEEWAREFGSSS